MHQYFLNGVRIEFFFLFDQSSTWCEDRFFKVKAKQTTSTFFSHNEILFLKFGIITRYPSVVRCTLSNHSLKMISLLTSIHN